jgi:hypothetical protein
MRTTHTYLARGIAAAVVVQFFLAGAGAFGASSFAPHRTLGWLLLLLAVVELLFALAGRVRVRHSGVLLAAVGLQVALGVLGTDTSAWFGALHAVNALVVLGAAATLARPSDDFRSPRRSESAAGSNPQPRRAA